MNDIVLFDKHTFDEMIGIIQNLDEQAIVSPEMHQRFTKFAQAWEADMQKTATQLQRLLDQANQLPHSNTDTSLVIFAETLQNITEQFGASEQDFQQDVDMLKQSLHHLQQRRNQHQALVLAAQQFSLVEIQSEQQKRRQELENLGLFALEESQADLMQLRTEISKLVETLQRREAQYNGQQQALEALGMTEEELRSRELSTQKALEAHEAQARLRNLRLSCLEKAREIQYLRQALQQHIGHD